LAGVLNILLNIMQHYLIITKAKMIAKQ